MVARVLCEVLDYVEWKMNTWRVLSICAAVLFVQFNIVRDSFRADIWLARGNHGTVIEEAHFARRVRCQL